MRILVIASEFPKPSIPYRGMQNYEHIKYQSKFNDISVLSPNYDLSPLLHNTRTFLHVQNKNTDVQGILRSLIESNIKVYYPNCYISPSKSLHWGRNIYILSKVLPTIRQIRKTFQFDLIHAYSLFPDSIFGSLIARLYKIPFIVSIPESTRFDNGSLVLSDRHLKSLLGRSCKNIYLSKFVQTKMKELVDVEDMAAFISPGVDILRFFPRDPIQARKELGLPLDKQILFYFGNCMPNDGLNYLIDAMEIISPKLPDLRLVILGTGPLLSASKRKVKKLCLEDTVIFRQEFELDTLPTWYNAADILLYPNVDFGGYTPILQSMACGTPSITASFDGIKEVMKGNDLGFIANLRDSHDWAQKIEMGIKKVWNQYDLVTRAKSYNMHKKMAELQKCYNDIA